MRVFVFSEKLVHGIRNYVIYRRRRGLNTRANIVGNVEFGRQ